MKTALQRVRIENGFWGDFNTIFIIATGTFFGILAAMFVSVVFFGGLLHRALEPGF